MRSDLLEKFLVGCCLLACRVMGYPVACVWREGEHDTSKLLKNQKLTTSILYFSYGATKGYLILFPMFFIPIGWINMPTNSIPMKFLFLCFPHPMFQRGGRASIGKWG